MTGQRAIEIAEKYARELEASLKVAHENNFAVSRDVFTDGLAFTNELIRRLREEAKSDAE